MGGGLEGKGGGGLFGRAGMGAHACSVASSLDVDACMYACAVPLTSLYSETSYLY